MKRIVLSFLLLIGLPGVSPGQEFTVAPNPTFVEGVADDAPLIAYAELTNDTYESKVVVWERIVEDIPEEWTTNVCTSEGCILAEIPMGDFPILPGEGLNVDIQFNTEGVAGTGLVEVKLYFEGDSANFVMVTYHGNAMATSVSVEEQTETSIEIFPNPMDAFFSVKGGADISYIKIFDVFGNLVSTLANSQSEIDVKHLPPGFYYFAFFEEEEMLLQIIRASVF